jgi:hypothetical protein
MHDSRNDPVNAGDADIVFRSSDKVLFKVHSRNLELHSNVFPSGEFVAVGEGDPVDLEESSDILELFFQYFYAQPQPDLSILQPDTMIRLGEAVEKYEVYSAMPICKEYMG